MKRKQRKIDIRGRAMAWLFLVCSLLGSLLSITTGRSFIARYWEGFSAQEMQEIFRVTTGPETRADTLLSDRISQALNGELDAMSQLRVYDLSGQEIDAFNQRELTHMEDVVGLYRLAWQVMYALMAVECALFLWVIWAVWCGKTSLLRIAKGALWGLVDGAILALLLGAWALIDFRSIFWLFHQVAFTNDLWLLNPETDLLIRMMPLAFFQYAVEQIALRWFTWIPFWVAIWNAVRIRTKHVEESR